MRTVEERVHDLEADAYRDARSWAVVDARLEKIDARLGRIDGRLDHLTDAVGDLSQDVRGIRHQIGEFRTEVMARLAAIEAAQAGQAAMLQALLAHFGIDAVGPHEPGA